MSQRTVLDVLWAVDRTAVAEPFGRTILAGLGGDTIKIEDHGRGHDDRVGRI